MDVDGSLTAPTEGPVDMALSPQPSSVDRLSDEHMMYDEEVADETGVVDDGDFEVEGELDLDEDEVAMADHAADPQLNQTIDSELDYSEPQPFDSPPVGLVNPDGTQTSVLGHSGEAQTDPLGSPHLQPFELDDCKIEADLPDSAQNQLDPSATPYVPEASVGTHASSHQHGGAHHAGSQSRSLSPSRALAAQHQHSSDQTKHQDQSIEHLDSHHQTLSQSQDMHNDDGSDQAKQRNQVDIEHRQGQPGERDEVEVSTKQSNEGGKGGKGGPPVQTNQVNVYEDGPNGQAKANKGCTCGGAGPSERPKLRKDLLEGVEFDEESLEQGSSPAEPNTAPVVALVHQATTYSLFRPTTNPASGQPYETLYPTAPLSQDSPAQPSPELYYAPISSLFAALRTSFTAIPTSDELVISFEAIGISLAEDNVHACQVSLFDFDRIQVGCGLPGTLQITLESQQRFSTGFNALVEHIARTREGGGSLLAEAAAAESAAEEGYAGADDGSFVDGEYGGGEGAPATDDETAVGEGDESEYYDPEGERGEAFNLEEALADMDSDDLEAVIDGAEEDYIESEEAVYEAHDGDDHDDWTEGEDLEPDVLLPEETNEAPGAEEEDEEPRTAVIDEVGVGLEDVPAGGAAWVAGSEEILYVAVAADELVELDEAAELYEAAAQEVEGILDEPLETEAEAEARSLTDTLEDVPVDLADADADAGVGADAALDGDLDSIAVEATAAEVGADTLDDASGLMSEAELEGEVVEAAVEVDILGPKRGRDDELLAAEGAEEGAEGASKRAKLDEDELIG